MLRQMLLEMLKKRIPFKERRIEDLKQKGYPVYITSAGWLGYSDEKVREVVIILKENPLML